MTERRHDQLRCLLCLMPTRKSGQVVPGAHFQKHLLGIFQQDLQALNKSHWASQLPGPILWIRSFRVSDESTGDIRNISNLRGLQFDCSYQVGEAVKNRIHHGRMKRMGGMKTSVTHIRLREPGFQMLNSIGGPGHDARRWFIQGSDREIISQNASTSRSGRATATME